MIAGAESTRGHAMACGPSPVARKRGLARPAGERAENGSSALSYVAYEDEIDG